MATPPIISKEIPDSQAKINEELFQFQAELKSEMARAKMKLDVLIMLMENRKSKAEDEPQTTLSDGILVTQPSPPKPQLVKAEYETLFAQDDHELQHPILHLDSTIGDVQSIEEQVEVNDCSVFGKTFVQKGTRKVFDEMSRPNPSDFQLEREYHDTDVSENVELHEIQEVFAEMPNPVTTFKQSFYMEYWVPNKSENHLSDEEQQHLLMKMDYLKVFRNLFDERTPTFSAEVRNDQQNNPYVTGINFNNITLFDPGGEKRYAMSSIRRGVHVLFGTTHRTCDNFEAIDGRKNVMTSEGCSDLCIWFDELTEASRTALFNEKVNEHYAHYLFYECPQPFLDEQSDKNGRSVDKGGVVLLTMKLQSVLNLMDETTINGSCKGKGSTKARIGKSISIMESVWGKTVMNDHAHLVFGKTTYPSPTFHHSFSVFSSSGMEETDGSYYINVDNLSFYYWLNDNMWLTELLMLIFDPGRCSCPYRGCDLLEYNGKHGDFHSTTNVVDAPEYIYYAFYDDFASHSSKSVYISGLALGIRSTGFVRVAFDEIFCEQKQAFVLIMNSQEVLLHDIDKCNAVVMDVVHFPFSHPRDVVTIFLNIFIAWKVALEKVEGFLHREIFYSVRDRDEIETSASSIAVGISKVYVVPASLFIQRVPFDLAEGALLHLVSTLLIEFKLLGSNSLDYQQRVTYKNSQLLDGFKQCWARRCIDTEHLDVGLINKIGVPIVTSVVHFNEMFWVTMYHLNDFDPGTKANVAKRIANGVHMNLECIGVVFVGILVHSIKRRLFDPGGNFLR